MGIIETPLAIKYNLYLLIDCGKDITDVSY